MCGLNRMTGTVWHIERYERSEGDERRHRSRCVNYKGKPDGICKLYDQRCYGAAHCDFYKEKDLEQPIEMMKSSVIKKNSNVVVFKGIKELPLSEIIVSSMFTNKSPKVQKIDKVVEYFKTHGELDKPIVVNIRDGKYNLQDKYDRLLAAMKLGLKTVPAEMGTKDEIKERDAIRKIGTLVWQNKQEKVGKVVETSLSRVVVKSEDGSKKTYDIYLALKTKSIRVL